MPESTMPAPRYSIWQALAVALNLATRAIEEVRALARDGGKPGPAGLGFDDFSVEHDGERTFTFRLSREGIAPKEWTFTVPAQIHRGPYRENQTYELGDAVTYAGCQWVARGKTSVKPSEAITAWALVSKTGRDGADAYQVAKKAGFDGTKEQWLKSLRGPPGPEGKAGRDLTQRGPNGERW